MKGRINIAAIAVVSSVIIVANPSSWACSTSTFSYRVTSPFKVTIQHSENPIRGVEVQVIQQRSNEVQVVATENTDQSGEVVFRSVPVGIYKIRVAHQSLPG